MNHDHHAHHHAPAANTVKDPVCGMNVDPAKTQHHTRLGDNDYYFCSKGCLEKFKANPGQYTQPVKAHSCCHGQRTRAPIQRLADKVSGYFVPAVILVAIIAAIVWGGLAPAQAAVAGTYATKTNPSINDINAMMYWYETASRSKAGGYSWTYLGHQSLAELYCGEFCVRADFSHVKDTETAKMLETDAKKRIERLRIYNIPRDYVKAYIHYDLAGNMKENYREMKKKLETQMTEDQITQAKACLSAWKLSGDFCYDNQYNL